MMYPVLKQVIFPKKMNEKKNFFLVKENILRASGKLIIRHAAVS